MGNKECSCFDESVAIKQVLGARALVTDFVKSTDLFTPPILELHQVLDEGNEFTELTEDGDEQFLGPFLDDDEYLETLAAIFAEVEESTGSPMSAELKGLYTVSWSTPSAKPSSAAAMFTKVIVVLIMAAALLAICCTVIMYYCNKSRRQRYGPYTYTPLKDDEMEEAIREQNKAQ